MRRNPRSLPVKQLAGDIARIRPDWNARKASEMARLLADLRKISRRQLRERLLCDRDKKTMAVTAEGRTPVKITSENEAILIEKIWRILHGKGFGSERKLQRLLWKRWRAEDGWDIAQQLKEAHPDWSPHRISGEVRAILASDRAFNHAQRVLDANLDEDVLKLLNDLSPEPKGRKKKGGQKRI